MHNLQINFDAPQCFETRFFTQIRDYYRECGYALQVKKYDSNAVFFQLVNEKDCFYCACLYRTNPRNAQIEDTFHILSDIEKYGKTTILFINQDEFDPEIEPLRHFETVFVNRNKLRELQGLKNEIGVHYRHIQLHSHNDIAYEIFVKEKQHKTALVRATGTGKRYLIARISQDFLHHPICIFAPNHYILEQQKKVFNPPNIHFYTYQSLISAGQDFTLPEGTKVVFLDEYHRLGAECWCDAVMKAIGKSGAMLVGTSATPIRYLDKMRNMTEEIFDGHAVAELPLSNAIGRGILPEPVYVSALYEIDESVSFIKQRINQTIKIPQLKKEYLDRLDDIEIDWRQSDGIADIIRYHMPTLQGNYIVFCENISHLACIKKRMVKWMNEALDLHNSGSMEVNIFTVHSNKTAAKNHHTLESFESQKTGVNLLFAVDILNEGKHIESVDGLFFFRKTYSPIIYQQQVGRSLAANQTNPPIIFDFVSNINNFENIVFSHDVENIRRGYNENRLKHRLKPLPLSTRFEYQLVNFKEKLRALEEQTKRFDFDIDNIITLLGNYKEEYGHLLIKRNVVYQNIPIGMYMRKIRGLIKSKQLDTFYIKKLAEMGFVVSPSKYKHERLIENLLAYKNENGHCDVPYHYVTKNGEKLGAQCQTKRQKYRSGKLSPATQKSMEDVGFNFTSKKDLFFEEYYPLFKAFYDTYGHLQIPRDYMKNDIKLGCVIQNIRRRNARLNKYKSTEQMRRLYKIGFTDTAIEGFQIKSLKEYLSYTNKSRPRKQIPSPLRRRLQRIKALQHQGKLKKSVLDFMQKHNLLSDD